MKFKLLPFFLLFVLVPLIIIPLICFKTGNFYGLFGAVFYYVGLIIARFKLWIFFPIPVCFCLWYWYTYGFGLRDYVTIYFACMMAGIMIQQIFKEVYKYVSKVLPEQESNLEYNEKVEQLHKQIENYKKAHPQEKITQELIEKIRTEIFFQ